MNSTVREPVVAGTFYPAESAALTRMVRSHLDTVKGLPAVHGKLIALIVPHAGLVYSGSVAAYSYELLENTTFNKVILCGPSHRFGFEGLSVYGAGITWTTPLGSVRCNDALCKELLRYDRHIDVVEQAQIHEHSLEVQLPYLQTVLRQFEIVPVVLGQQDKAGVRLLAEALESLEFDANTIMVASTDWQHYRPAAEGRKMDLRGLDCLEHLDATRLEKYLRNGDVEMCGGGVALAVLKAAIAKGADKAKVLKYADSGDVSGDKGAVVGYAAVAIYKSSARGKGSKANCLEKARTGIAPLPMFQLSGADKRTLLEIARASIKGYLAEHSPPKFVVADHLREPGAAFVTLKWKGQLRGCIGHPIAREPLNKTVSICAVQAATADPRFFPVTTSELTELDIEISVLTPLQKIKSPDEIEVGRDGILIELGSHCGLLLPQVATEYGWDNIQFLKQTCRKAGLQEDAYLSPDAVIYRFQAIVFGEKELLTD